MLETQFSTIASYFTVAIQELQWQAQRQEQYQAQQQETMQTLLSFLKHQSTNSIHEETQTPESGQLSTPTTKANPPTMLHPSGGSTGAAGHG